MEVNKFLSSTKNNTRNTYIFSINIYCVNWYSIKSLKCEPIFVSEEFQEFLHQHTWNFKNSMRSFHGKLLKLFNFYLWSQSISTALTGEDKWWVQKSPKKWVRKVTNTKISKMSKDTKWVKVQMVGKDVAGEWLCVKQTNWKGRKTLRFAPLKYSPLICGSTGSLVYLFSKFLLKWPAEK